MEARSERSRAVATGAPSTSDRVVVHLGSRGSFSEEAALAFAARERLELEPRGCSAPEAVLEELRAGRAAWAVLPVANSSSGLVRGALEPLLRGAFELAGEITLPVRISLWVAREEIACASIEVVASHPQAFLQCERSLARELPGRVRLEWTDTGSAARDLASGVLDPHVAVLASERAGALHGLARRASDLQDDPENRTHFVVVQRCGP